MADVEGNAKNELRIFCERIERLSEEKQTLADDIKEVKAEAKSKGYDAKMIGEMLKLRAMDKDERIEREHIRDTYALALGLFD